MTVNMQGICGNREAYLQPSNEKHPEDHFGPFAFSDSRNIIMQVLLTVRSYIEPILSLSPRRSIRETSPVVFPVYSLLNSSRYPVSNGNLSPTHLGQLWHRRKLDLRCSLVCRHYGLLALI